MVKRDNPAGRLHEILTQARNQGNMATILMWAKVLGADPENKTEIIRRISHLQELADDVKEKISKVAGLNTQLYLSRFPDIENVVKATNYDAAWDNYKPQLNEAAMLNLAHCAEALSRYDEDPIDETELTELLKSIDELSEKLRKSPVGESLKAVIIDLLETIRRSIGEYRIRGAEGMRRELTYCVGAFVQNHTLFKTEDAKEEIGMFGKIMSKLNMLINFALKLKELGLDLGKISGLIGDNPSA